MNTCMVCGCSTDEKDEICSFTCWLKLPEGKKDLVIKRRIARLAFDAALQKESA